MVTVEVSGRESLDAIGHVLAYVSGQWYETEYGQVEDKERWYHDAMVLIEDHLAAVARGGWYERF